jgi:hypothetical protein
VVVLLADAQDDVRGSAGDPRLEPARDVVGLVGQLGDPAAQVKVRDDDQAEPLAEAA